MLLIVRRLIVSSLLVSLMVMNISLSLSAEQAVQTAAANGVVSGTARSADGQPSTGATARLRNVQNGALTATTTTGPAGQFSFAGLAPGNYVVELVVGGQVVGTSTAVSLTTASMVASGINVAATAATAAAAGGGSFFATTAGIVTIAAVAAGVAGVTVAANRDDASPSR